MKEKCCVDCSCGPHCLDGVCDCKCGCDSCCCMDCICGQTKNPNGHCDGSHSNVCEENDLDQNEDVPFADKLK